MDLPRACRPQEAEHSRLSWHHKRTNGLWNCEN